MDTGLVFIQLLNGLQLGILLFLLAAGLTLVFGIMDFVNLAHGSLYMMGAFFVATLAQWSGSFLLAVALSIPLVVLLGIAVELVAIRTLYPRDHLDQVLATFGLILFFDGFVHLVWGANGMTVPLPDWLEGQIVFSESFSFPTFRVLIISVGLAVALGLFLVVTRTRIGMLIRAGASNRTMVGALGVDIKTLFTLVFAGGAALAGLAGMMISPITEASIGMGNQIIIVAFVVIIIGGIGSIRGAFIAALLVGMIDVMGRSYLDGFMKLFMDNQSAETASPALSAMAIYILMAAILYFRPRGLFPPRHR